MDIGFGCALSEKPDPTPFPNPDPQPYLKSEFTKFLFF